MPFSTNISSSAFISLGVGSDTKTTWVQVGFETGSGFSGSINVMKRVSGQPSAQPVYYMNFFNGNYQNTPLTGSVSFMLENHASEVFLSSSIVSGTGSVYWATVAG